MTGPYATPPTETAPFVPGSRGRVMRAPANAHPQLLTVRPAEEISAVSYDARWPGYVLCGSLSGQNGWVPKGVLHYIGPGMAVVRGDYSASVLSVTMGEELVLHDEANGGKWSVVSGRWAAIVHRLSREAVVRRPSSIVYRAKRSSA